MKDYWNRAMNWMYESALPVGQQLQDIRRDTAHSGQIPRCDVPLHTTYIRVTDNGTVYIDAHTLSMTGWTS